MPKYNRVMIKISGEALAGDGKRGFDLDFIGRVCQTIKHCVDAGVQVGIVVGGGNIWRGMVEGKVMNDRVRADQMGMLATTINALALAENLETQGVDVRVMTAIEMRAVAEPYYRARAMRHLEKGRVVIFAGGLGIPYVSTDTAVVLRAVEVKAEIVLLAKNIDGVYDADPAVDPAAKKYDSLDYDTILRDDLRVMDATATAMSRDNALPILVFALQDPQNIYRAVNGEKIGTIVRAAE
ncbi:MAG: UMP kinase [Oscillospiraceae bacterium]|nr:UMP kinase [Oscillospiraceae bacterium]